MSKAKNERPSEFINELPPERQLMTLRGLYDMCITMLNEKDTEIEELKEKVSQLNRLSDSRKNHVSMLIEASENIERLCEKEIEALKVDRDNYYGLYRAAMWGWKETQVADAD